MDGYSLIDFGNGRRLERFGCFVFDRPCPAAENLRQADPKVWRDADYRFTIEEKGTASQRGCWTPNVPPPFVTEFGPLRLSLHGTPFGHLGVFPEQYLNWNRLTRILALAATRRQTPIRVLNLFAYTGGSSIAAALAGPEIEVVHVDSSKSVVEWAGENARLNGVESRIRLIVEDARKFVARELRRKSRYGAVILDPPSYGHGVKGVKGNGWKLSEHLDALVSETIKLLDDDPVLYLLTAHTPEYDADRLQRLVEQAEPPCEMQAERFSMLLRSDSGKNLPSGCGVIYTGPRLDVPPLF